jgi:hypothetical protein
MRRVSTLLACVVVAGCTDTFTERYATLDAARRDRIFERGWLPDILPASTHSLRVSGDVDINTADGEFSLRTSDFETFHAKLRSAHEVGSLPATAKTRMKELGRSGYAAAAYKHDDYAWLFLCNKEMERCEYLGWPER